MIPAASTHWWRWARWPVSLSLCAAVAAFAWQSQFAFSASANQWLAGLTHLGGGAFGMIGRSLRGIAGLVGAEDLGSFISYIALVLGVLQLLLLVLIGRLVGMGDRSLALPLLLLATAGGRANLATVGAESVLAPLTLGLCAAIYGMQRYPKQAALAAGVSFFVLTVAHPMGAVALPVLLIVAGMFPRPQQVGDSSMQGFAGRPTWLPWLGALALFAALLLLSLPQERFVAAWEALMRALRAPSAAPRVGGIADLPLVGAPLAALLHVPLPILVLACAGALRGWREDATNPLSVVASSTAAWLVATAVVGRPTPAPIAISQVILPLLVVLAGFELGRWSTLAWHLTRQGQVAAVALVATATLVSWMDGANSHRSDHRNALGRIGAMVADRSADSPARIASADLSLLRAHQETTAVLPGFRGGNTLARRLTDLKMLPKGPVHVEPFAARLILLHMPPDDAISQAWAERDPLDCAKDNTSCLFRLKAPR